MATRVGRGEAEAICAEYRASGLTQSEFCKVRGISQSTLCHWLYRRCRKSSKATALVRVNVQPTTVAGVIRIRVKDGIVIELPRPVDAEELRNVLLAAAAL